MKQDGLASYLSARVAAAGLIAGRRYWLSFAAAAIGLTLVLLDSSREVVAGFGGLLAIAAHIVTFFGYRKHSVSLREEILLWLGLPLAVYADWFGRALLLFSLLRRRR